MRVIWSLAATTLGEAVRRKVLLVILLVGVLFLAIAPGMSVLSARSSAHVLKSMTLGIVQLTSAVIAIVLTVYMIPNEIERRTIYTILCKPVQRWQFLVGKYFGAVLALGLMMALMTAVMSITYLAQQQGDFQGALTLVQAPLMFFVQMSLLAAVAIFFSTFVSPLVNFFLSGGIFLVGSMFNPFFKTLEENQSIPWLAQKTAWALNVLLPNFADFNVQTSLLNPQQTIGNETIYYAKVTAYGLFYIGAMLVAGIFVFDRKEV